MLRQSRLYASAILLAACSEQPRVVAKPPDPQAIFRSHIGQRWELIRLGSTTIGPPPVGTAPDAPGRDLVPGRRPTIRFDSTMNFGGRSFCNGYGGPYVVRGDSIEMGMITSSAVGCDGPDSLETRFFRALREARRFEMDSTTLSLVTIDGTRTEFARADSTTTYP